MSTISALNESTPPVYVPGTGRVLFTGTGTLTLSLECCETKDGTFAPVQTVSKSPSAFPGVSLYWRLKCTDYTEGSLDVQIAAV